MKLKQNEEITSKYLLIVEVMGENLDIPVAVKREDFQYPKNEMNLVEIGVDGETSVCGLFDKTKVARFNARNVFKVADSIHYQAKEKAGLLPKHLMEQFSHRKKVCKPCLDNGKCLVCGCKTPGRMYSRSACAGGKYPALMNEQEWEKYKVDQKILGEEAQRSERS